MSSIRIAVLFALCIGAAAFIAPTNRLARVAAPRTKNVSGGRLFSFTPQPGEKERKITRRIDEEGQYFESEFDRQPLSEKLPLAGAVLAGVSLPFLIGLIYLYSNK